MATGVVTFVFFAFERWLATYLVADYERRRRPWIAVLLLLLVHVSSFLYSLFFSFGLLLLLGGSGHAEINGDMTSR